LACRTAAAYLEQIGGTNSQVQRRELRAEVRA